MHDGGTPISGIDGACGGTPPLPLQSAAPAGAPAAAPGAAPGAAPTSSFVAPPVSAGGPANTQLASILQSLTAAVGALANALGMQAAVAPPASAGQAMLTAPSSGAFAAPAAPAAPTPVTVTTPATPAAPAAPAGPIQLTAAASLAPADKALVEGALQRLSSSPTAQKVFAEFNATGSRIQVLSDEEFAAQGLGGANGSFDPKTGIVNLRRSKLQLALTDPTSYSALGTLVHEAAHAVDTRAKVGEAFFTANNAQFKALGGNGTAAGQAFQKSVQQTATLAIEARGHIIEGAIYREIGATIKDGRRISDVPVGEILANAPDPAVVAAAGGTYEQVWRALELDPAYNPSGGNSSPVRFER